MIAGYYIKREDVFLGKKLKYGESGNIKFLRLVRKGQGKWTRPVHETLEVTGETSVLKNPLIHFPAEHLREMVAKMNYYTDLNAKYLHEKGTKTSAFQIIFYPVGKFILNYFLKLGFLDGTHGFVHAMMMSFHSYLTRSKLYFLNKENKI